MGDGHAWPARGRYTVAHVESTSRQRALVIIPAWNEQAAIVPVVLEARATLPDYDILVVNDGSTDNTAAAARAAGAEVLDLPLNLGVGGAMRAGYKYALRRGYRIAIQLDGDGQHDPSEVPRLVAALQDDGVDLVIGARFAGAGEYSVRGPRSWAMKFLAVTLTRVTRTKLTDTTSGFKAAGPRAIALFATDYPSEYLGDTVEALVIASRAGLRISQVGVAMRPRAAGEPSHNPFKAAVFLGRAVMALAVALTRPALDEVALPDAPPLPVAELGPGSLRLEERRPMAFVPGWPGTTTEPEPVVVPTSAWNGNAQ